MRLTLLRAKEALKGKAPADKLEYRLNRACERLMTSGKYSGSLHRVAFAAPYGQLSLPRHYRTVEGVKVDGTVYDITNHWFEFLPGHSDLASFSMNNVRDLGDGHAILRDLPSGGSFALTYSSGHVGLVTIYGTDSQGLPLTLEIEGFDTPDNDFTHIDRIHKEQGEVSISLSHVADDATVTPLAIMAPKEEEPFYRRYMIDSLTDQASVAVVALCKLRHIEFTDDADILPFANISALELALDALQYEAENDLAAAANYWDRAIKVLNDELGDTNARSTIPVIRFIYPGRTTPNFRSTL